MSVFPVRVAVPLPVDGLFTYRSAVPLMPGIVVRVPFGKRELFGWVIENGDLAEATRDILDIVGAEPAWTPEQLAFYRWIASYYLSPLGEVIATATPSEARARTRRCYRATDAGIEAIATSPPAGDSATVLRELILRPGLTRAGVRTRLQAELADPAASLDELVRAGLVVGTDVEVAPSVDMEAWVAAIPGADVAALSTRAVKARELLALLADGPRPAAGLDAPALRRLEKEGLVRRDHRSRQRLRTDAGCTTAPTLNAEQVAAVEGVRGPGTWLLHGVTGSGKTEVYLALAARARAEGRQVLVLVPEISLTPQLTDRFAGRFPNDVAVLHSGLAPAERLREWRRIRGGEVNVAVGARSALFAPFARLGLLVVDEENDDSYKQEDGVRYHARDLAVVRGRLAGCPVVLGSATPSMETWENARAGRYRLLSLHERATARPVPRVELVDLRLETEGGKSPMVAAPILAAIREALDHGGKAILLHNRRGYATFVECPGCGEAYDCPSCGIAMVFHQRRATLECHYCGFHRPFRPDCPKCGTTLAILGRGTERVEEAVAELFPGVPVGRMDADTTSSRGAHARILDAFRAGETRLLVGTQIVAKGHDFPDVHVAAVLGADHILGMPDFRSAERTFALVTQLCGRAGRGDVAGRVFVQTHHPDHPVWQTIGNMGAFAATEDRVRKALRYPPFARLVLLRVEGVDRSATRAAAREIVARMKADLPFGVDVLGPAMAPLARLVGRWRMQVILRGRDPARFRAWIAHARSGWTVPSGVRLLVDVDPRSLT